MSIWRWFLGLLSGRRRDPLPAEQRHAVDAKAAAAAHEGTSGASIHP